MTDLLLKNKKLLNTEIIDFSYDKLLPPEIFVISLLYLRNLKKEV